MYSIYIYMYIYMYIYIYICIHIYSQWGYKPKETNIHIKGIPNYKLYFFFYFFRIFP